jgi:hypothetical protein
MAVVGVIVCGWSLSCAAAGGVASVAAEVTPSPALADVPSPDETSVTEPVIQAALAKPAWEPKSPFRVVPYGAFWADAIYASRRVNPGAFTLWVEPEQREGEGAFALDARRSRFGLNVDGPGIAALGVTESHGQVEIDFHGNFIVENRASVLLRNAYWEIRNEGYRLLIGQYWDVISPLNPESLNYSISWNAGNIGFRRAQFRYERFLRPAPDRLISLQMSMNQDIVPDFSSDPGVDRESAGWPVLEGRLGWRYEAERPAELGVSAHIGETGFDFLLPGPPPLNLPPADDQRFRTWSFSVDTSLPINDRLAMHAEYFTGANLSSFLGGINQGVCPCLRVPIRSTGGWVDLVYQWSPSVQTAVGYSLDDPRNNDSLFGRTYNQAIFANVLFTLSEPLQMGFEVGRWTTHYREQRAGLIPDEQLTPQGASNAVTLQWMFKYGF